MPLVLCSSSSLVINHINLAGPSASGMMLLLCSPGREMLKTVVGRILRWSETLNVIYVIAAASWPAGAFLACSFATVGCWILCTAQFVQQLRSFWLLTWWFIMKPVRSSEAATPSESISSRSICLPTAHTRPLLILHGDL